MKKESASVNSSAFSQKGVEYRKRSPLNLLVISIMAIVLAEAIEMTILALLHLPKWWMDMAFDVAVMTLVITPILYFLPYRNLLGEISNRKKSENQLRTVLENLPVGVVITDRYGNIIHGNRASSDIWSGLRLVGPEDYGEYKAWWAHNGELVKPEEWGASRAITKGEASFDDEVEIETFDGIRKTILNSAVPIYDETNNLQGAVVVNQDITTRRKIELELEHNYELMEKYFSSIDTLIAYMDRDFNFIRVNDSYARSAGHTPDYFSGKNHFVLYPHEENQNIFQNVVDTGVPFTVLEKPFENPEFPERGTTYWNWSLQPVKRADGWVEGLVLSLIDVTERKKAQIQLDQQNMELLLLSKTEHHARELAEGLVDASIAVNSSLDLNEVLDHILNSLRRAIPFRMSTILLLDEETFTIAHHWGILDGGVKFPPTDEHFPINKFPHLLTIKNSRQPLVIPDSSLIPDGIAITEPDWMRSFLGAPLAIGTDVIGIITLRSDKENAFTQEEVNRLMAFAAPAAVAINNARVYSAELHSHQITETLNEAATALSQTLDLETIIDSLLDFLNRLVRYDAACVYLVDKELQLTLRGLRRNLEGIYPTLKLNTVYELWDEPYLQAVITTQKTLLIRDTAIHEGWTDFHEGVGIDSWIGVPMITAERVIGVVVLAQKKPNFFANGFERLVEAIVAQASVVIQNAWLYEQVRNGHEELQSVFHRLVEVQESERRYVARELHDETSQALTSLMINLNQLEKGAENPNQVRTWAGVLKNGINTVLEDLHRLAMNLRPAALDILGLVPTVEQMVKDFEKQYSVKISLRVSGEVEQHPLSSDIETTIYRIIQESLTNVARHSKAEQVDVILEYLDDKIVTMIEDNGVGYDPEIVQQSGRLGVLGMRERAQMAGGLMQIESNPGRGTTVVVEIPYDRSNIDR